MSEAPYNVPMKPDKADGSRRCMGVEIEMSGIYLAMIACQINIAYGGRIDEVSPYEFIVNHTEIGKVELDFQYLKGIGKEKACFNRWL